MNVHALYESVTNSIIKQLEDGTAPWVRPWKNGKNTGIMPHNGATNRSYNGINVMLLWAEREVKGYKTIAFDPARFSRHRNFPGPPELGAVDPDPVHDHGQPARQRHDRLFHPAVLGDLHRRGLSQDHFAKRTSMI
jgi:hypothetical protein